MYYLPLKLLHLEEMQIIKWYLLPRHWVIQRLDGAYRYSCPSNFKAVVLRCWLSTQLCAGGPRFKARLRNAAMYTNSTLCMHIYRGCNVLQVPIQTISLGVPKWGSHPLHDWSKLQLHVPDRWQLPIELSDIKLSLPTFEISTK